MYFHHALNILHLKSELVISLTMLKLKQHLDQAADMITKYEMSQEEKNKELQSLKVIFMFRIKRDVFMYSVL